MGRRNRPRGRFRTLARFSWIAWFSTGIACFSLLRLLAWSHFSAEAPAHLTFARIAAAAAWLLLGMMLLLALKAAWNENQRAAWLRRQRSIEAIRRLSWQEFECLIADLYAHQGFHVDLVGQGGADGGVDVILRRHRKELVLVQCKHWKSNRVSVTVVREMLGLAVHHQATAVIIICCEGFTKDARAFARDKQIQLVDGAALVDMIVYATGR